MPQQACLSMRPGTILGYDGRVWKVLENNTLDTYFILETIDDDKVHEARRRKRVVYRPGQEVTVRWVPHDSHNQQRRT